MLENEVKSKPINTGIECPKEPHSNAKPSGYVSNKSPACPKSHAAHPQRISLQTQRIRATHTSGLVFIRSLLCLVLIALSFSSCIYFYRPFSYFTPILLLFIGKICRRMHGDFGDFMGRSNAKASTRQIMGAYAHEKTKNASLLVGRRCFLSYDFLVSLGSFLKKTCFLHKGASLF